MKKLLFLLMFTATTAFAQSIPVTCINPSFELTTDSQSNDDGITSAFNCTRMEITHLSGGNGHRLRVTFDTRRDDRDVPVSFEGVVDGDTLNVTSVYEGSMYEVQPGSYCSISTTEGITCNVSIHYQSLKEVISIKAI